MLKQTVTYTDFDNVKHVDEVLHFHISEPDLSKLIPMQDMLTRWEANVKRDGNREMTNDEKLELLEILQLFLTISYGERHGSQFRKSPEVFNAFRWGGAHDAYLMWLIQDIERIDTFIQGILPPELLEQALDLRDKGITAALPTEAPTSTTELTKNDQDKWDGNSEPTQQQLMNMDKAELLRAMAWKEQNKR